MAHLLRRCLLLAAAFVLLPATLFAVPIGFIQTNLVSDGAVPAAVTDPDLKNPWGISFGPATPFWVADNATGKSTLYTGDGAKQGLIVTVLPAPGSPAGTIGSPTGTVFNPTTDFSGDRFVFATQDGTLGGWQPALGQTAAVRVDNSFAGASYTGMALLGDRIYAANFAVGTIDTFENDYTPILANSFLDPNLPAGYAPFNIQALGGELYVAYAKLQPNSPDEEAGAGLGIVNVFDKDGTLIRRLVTGIPGDPASPLNAPWGLALAPAGFGDFGGDVLVGNFGDGRINAFDAVSGAFVDTLRDELSAPIVIGGLWALAFGNAGLGFDAGALYFTAGLNDEADGLFGRLQPAQPGPAAPEPAATLLVASGLVALLARRRLMA